MRRRLVFLIAWTAVTAVAVAGSWVGLQPVLDAASPHLPTRLSAGQLHEPTPPPDGGLASPTAPASVTPEPVPPPASPDQGLPEAPVSSQWEAVRRSTWERTFVLRGGEVVVQVNRRSVDVISRTPNPGYEVTVTRWTRSSVIVAFHNQDEEASRVWVMWRNGPYAEVTETV